MKYLILLSIKLYWFVIPAHKRNKCLFKETCSVIVYRNAKEKGFWNAIKVFNKRRNICTPKYVIMIGEEFIGLQLKNLTKITYGDLSITLKEEVDSYKCFFSSNK